MMKPEPSEVPRRCCCSPFFLSKNSLNSSSKGEPGGSCGMSRRRWPCCGTFCVVVMLTTVGISLSTRSAKLSGASRAWAGATKAGWTSPKPKTVTADTTAFLENAETSPKITATSNGAQGLCERIRPAPRILFLSTCRPNVAQIKRPLCCWIFQPFEGLAKKEPAAWQDCHIAGSDFCRPDAGYFRELFLGEHRRAGEVLEEVAVRAQHHRRAARSK